MVIPAEIQRRFAEDARRVSEVESRVRDTLREYCSENGFVFDGRTKALDSLTEKIETGRFKSWRELDDLYACTIAVPLPSDEDRVLQFLEKSFQKIKIRSRGSTQKAANIFRFDGTRFYGQLLAPDGIELGGTIFEQRFEVQIKSLFEFAWSKTTHALAYKTSSIDWRAQRLAASIKATVEQTDLLLSRFEESLDGIRVSPHRETEQKQAIQKVFLDYRSNIPSEVWPKDLSRLTDNCYALVQVVQKKAQEDSRDRTLNIHPNVLHDFTSYLESVMDVDFPRSISLFQIFLGVTTSRFPLPQRSESYFPITSELETLFPHLSNIEQRFRFD